MSRATAIVAIGPRETGKPNEDNIVDSDSTQCFALNYYNRLTGSVATLKNKKKPRWADKKPKKTQCQISIDLA